MKTLHILLSLLLFILIINVASAEYWNDSWSSYSTITMNATTPENEFQVQLTDSTFTIPLAMWNEMNQDGNDTRIINYNHTIEFPHWIDHLTARDNYSIWVNVTDNASSTYQWYYGNPSADSTSNGDDTFEFFDDFESITLEEWKVENGYATHCAIIKDNSYYTTRWNATAGQIIKINVTTGAKEDSLDVTRYSQSAPFISGNYLYSYISEGRIYKTNLSNFSDNSYVAVTFNDLTEAIAFDDTHFYLSESSKISKRNLSDMAEVDSFACTEPRGTLIIGSMIYFITQNGKFYAVDTSDMTESWHLDLDYTTIKTYCVPIYDSTHDRIYIVDSNVDRSGGHVYGINLTNHSEEWVKTYTGGVVSTPVYYNDRLFFSVYNSGGTGTHKALNVSTDSPTEVWSKQYHTDSAWGGFAADDTYLYTVTKHNSPYYFIILRQSDGVMVHSEGVTDQKACNVPVLSDGRAIVGVLDNLYCFKVGTGNAVDSLYYHVDQNYAGHISNAITSYNPFDTGYVLTDKWTSIAGTWAVSDGILHQTASTGWKELRVKDYTNSGDFAIQMSFKAIDDKEVMFSLHHQDLDNYVQAQARTANDKLRVIREIGGGYELWESGAVTIDTGTWYDFETKISGLNYNLTLDSFNWNQTIDSDPGFGAIEIGVYDGSADFDDISIRKYNGNETFVTSISEPYYYADSLHYNATAPYNFTIGTDGTLTSNRSIITVDDTNWTAYSTGTTYWQHTTAVTPDGYTNLTISGSDLDNFTATNLTASTQYNLTNSSGTIEQQTTNGDGTTTFEVNLMAGNYWISSDAVTEYTPPTPTSLANSTGNFWVNYTWSAGSGNATDSYNVSYNGTWDNTSSNTFRNESVDAHGHLEIMVYAYNDSGVGTLSAGYLTDNVTVPNNVPTLSGVSSSYELYENSTFTLDANHTDADSDTITYSDNASEWDINSATGEVSWVLDWEDVAGSPYYYRITIDDGEGGTDYQDFTVTINGMQNTALTSVDTLFENGNPGTDFTDNTITLSFYLINSGSIDADISAKFTTDYESTYGLVSGTSTIGGSNFKLGNATLDALLDSGNSVDLTDDVPGEVTRRNYEVQLRVPAGQAALDYSGLIELTFSDVV